ncbi:RecB family exonuclease [Moorella thermoacetica Y72]|uniref:CRISPR-associated exonuclease Cas4 n=1 Tax=Moorella thermoacetica Y72 TaxID=1325331 RepID=A0A0S6UFH8_NEOTH|nr:CRISPR-associated protein Cas4 [Moorella thermoacetica]GAF26198.1 RecB family exonuclease [Moorella thermoacetica Y72]
MDDSGIPVNGTLIWYYTICHRQVWLMAHHLTPDQQDENVVLGRFIHENSYKRDRHELLIGDIKIDLVRGTGGKTLVGEIKKSSRSEQSARLQLKYYLYILRKYGLDINGVLFFPEEKRKEEIVLDEGGVKEVETAIAGIKRIISLPVPDPPVKVHWCHSCAYAEFCWA